MTEKRLTGEEQARASGDTGERPGDAHMGVVGQVSQWSGRSLVLLDSPGLFAPNRAAVFDAQLLAVLNLVSSVVVYNSRGMIDRAAMEKLSFAIDTAGAMAYMTSKRKTKLSSLGSSLPAVDDGTRNSSMHVLLLCTCC